ncbi:MAG TPA: histidine phosphatase family protein [Gaiellaceae bacterium]|nr:histidine phosphatase family protein [Gaiellaceae bacterium]
MTEILLARHGETDWNRERRVQGQTDRPLNEGGRRQAAELARSLAGEHLDAVYASDLLRAFDTARAVAEPRGLEVVALPALRERDFGTWEGLTEAEILDRFPHARTAPWGDAETREELAARVIAALGEIVDRHPGGRVLVVSHGGPIRAALRHCSAAAERPIVNCHVTRLAAESGVLTAID